MEACMWENGYEGGYRKRRPWWWKGQAEKALSKNMEEEPREGKQGRRYRGMVEYG